MSEPHTPAKLFVYGSLLDGFFNSDRSLCGKVISRLPARILGTLYHQSVKGYPAIRPGESAVYGELLELRDFASTIDALDEVENFYGDGAKNEYARRLTDTELLSTGEHLLAYVYWYARPDLGGSDNPSVLLPHGDWRHYMQTKGRK